MGEVSLSRLEGFSVCTKLALGPGSASIIPLSGLYTGEVLEPLASLIFPPAPILRFEDQLFLVGETSVGNPLLRHQEGAPGSQH